MYRSKYNKSDSMMNTKKSLSLLTILFIFTTGTSAQDVSTKTTIKSSVENGRYEVVQSEVARRFTFRLDKYTGDVCQLVINSNERNSWQKISRIDSNNDTKNPDKINYQLFMSGIALRDCFLLNINTGATWVLVQSEDDNVLFEPFDE